MFLLSLFFFNYPLSFFFFFFNDTATTEIYTLSLHDALPIPPSRAGNTQLERLAATPETLPREEVHDERVQRANERVLGRRLGGSACRRHPMPRSRLCQTTEPEGAVGGDLGTASPAMPAPRPGPCTRT